MKFSCWWALKLFHFDSWGLRKMHLKMVTLLQKSWQNRIFFWKNFIRCFDFWLVFWEMVYPVQMNILNSKCQVKLQKLQTNKKREIFKWKPQSKHPMNLLQKILHFVMILKVGLPSLNAIFSGPKSQNEKVSVPISKRITCRFPNSPYFYS